MKWRDVENTVARIFDKGEIKGFRKQDIILGPGESLVLIEEGKVGDVLTQTRLRNIAGGFTNWLSKKLHIGKDILFLFVDTRPFEIKTDIQETTKDYVTMNGAITTKMQIDVNDSPKLLNFMKEFLIPKYKKKGIIRKREVFDGYELSGKKLTTEDIEEKIINEMKARVFSPVIGRHDAEEFHGDTKIVKDIQTEGMIQLRKTLDMWGIMLQDLYTNFGDSDHDRAQKYAAGQRMEADMDDAEFTRVMRDGERRGEFNTMQVTKEEEAQDVHHAKNVERFKQKRKAELEIEKLEDSQDAESLKKMVELKEQMKAQKIKEFQETELKARDMDNRKDVDIARLEAEKAKFNLGTYKDAEMNEREHHINMMSEMAKISNVSQGKAPPTESTGDKRVCKNCGMNIQSEWKACPHCGKKV